MTNASESNKRIAKNTLFMYCRMLVTMLVSLYTSRIVLQTLGVEDFGIYNIVGGVVVLFTFINSAMSTGTQRHLSYELGKKNGNVTEVFSSCLHIHIVIAFIVLLLSETIGLWFINSHMNFPEGRMEAVNWVYQLSIYSCFINIIRVPYNAVIISYERMSFYAYIGIIETILKLLIVYLLLAIHIDKLITYSMLMLIVIFLITIIYIIYCTRNFPEIKIQKPNNKNKYQNLLSFSSWAIVGSIANLGLQQGLNVIINIYYGVALNAAIGIANQVNSAIFQFVSSFQQALNPQLTKTQAENDSKRQLFLIYKSSTLSYFIMIIIAVPIIVNLGYILSLWLGTYPLHTIELCRLIIIGVLIECISGPLWVTIFAIGKIKIYQIAISVILLLNLPISYIGGAFGLSPESMFIIRNGLYVIALIARLFFLKRLISLSISGFLTNVIMPITKTTFIIILPIILCLPELTANNFTNLVWKTMIILVYESTIIIFIGLHKNERTYFFSIIRNKIKK